MGFVLDTCVVSEFFKKRPEAGVLTWVDAQLKDALYLSVFSIGELRNGASRMASSRRRAQLEVWLETVKLRFGERLLGFGEAEAETWGKMTGLADSIGRPLPVIDALIAATAVENGHIVVTRNVEDFQRCGVETLDPWETGR